MIILKLIHESILFAWHALVANRVRTVLSLLGITIGIFSIIAVFTVFDSVEIAMREDINALGSDVLYVQKWPWAMGGDYPWWKYWQRPEPDFNDLQEIQKRSVATEAAAIMVETSRDIYYKNNTIEGVRIWAVSHDYARVMPFDLQNGRYFTQIESKGGSNVTIIGSDIASNLFNGIDAIGKQVKLFGLRMNVIGVVKKEGEDLFGNTNDDVVIVPFNFARNVLDVKNIGSTIAVKAKPMISNEQLRDELTAIMRSVRKLKPAADDDFAINETDIISQGFDSFFSVVALVGWVIGGFSLLVGGFGVANIMFVSVAERTNQIGIQKSLGAKRYFILLQFLFEAVFLSILGGVVGILLVYVILSLLLGSLSGFDFILTVQNISIGLGVSGLIGLLFGIIPAYRASRLDAVEAMRTTF